MYPNGKKNSWSLILNIFGRMFPQKTILLGMARMTSHGRAFSKRLNDYITLLAEPLKTRFNLSIRTRTLPQQKQNKQQK